MSRRTGVTLAAGIVMLVVMIVIIPNLTLERRIQERKLASELYQARCAGCHELEGGIGSPLDPRVLSSYGTAQLLFNYVRLAMPYEAPRTLSDEEYWLTVAHLLRSRGMVDVDAVVNEETAGGITLDGSES
ncbi:MAG: cytochrome c [Gemmatimonadota bacterium]|nr:cytochrome c [Gemmatimonadota bacterium]